MVFLSKNNVCPCKDTRFIGFWCFINITQVKVVDNIFQIFVELVPLFCQLLRE